MPRPRPTATRRPRGHRLDARPERLRPEGEFARGRGTQRRQSSSPTLAPHQDAYSRSGTCRAGEGGTGMTSASAQMPASAP